VNVLEGGLDGLKGLFGAGMSEASGCRVFVRVLWVIRERSPMFRVGMEVRKEGLVHVRGFEGLGLRLSEWREGAFFREASEFETVTDFSAKVPYGISVFDG
jgi:hypothetical protein